MTLVVSWHGLNMSFAPNFTDRPTCNENPSRGCAQWLDGQFKYFFLRSAMAGRLYKLQSKHISNSGFDQTFMPCSGYIIFAAEQRVGYQISWVDLQRAVNCP